MATTTPHLGLTKPDPNGDDDAWAPMLNGNADILDTQVKAALDNAAAANANANGRVSKAGDTMTGALTLAPASGTGASLRVATTGAADSNLHIDGAAGRWRLVNFRTGTSRRWYVGANVAAETGGNAGSDFVITRLNDSGAGDATALGINRANGAVSIGGALTVGNGLSVTGSIGASGAINWSPYGKTLYATQGIGLVLNTTDYITNPGNVWNQILVQGDPGWGSAINLQTIHATGAYTAMRFGIGATVFDFRNDGGAYKIGGGPWSDISDARFKDGIEPYTTGLSAILRITPKIYSYRAATGRDPTRRYIGGIAQDMLAAMPETVTASREILGEIDLEDALRLDAGPLPWALVNAVKELHAIVQAQATRIAALEAAL